MRVRRLTGAEIDIWRRVAETVTPRPGSTLPDAPVAPLPEPRPGASPGAVDRPAPVRTYAAASYTPPVATPEAPTGRDRAALQAQGGDRAHSRSMRRSTCTA